MTRNIPIIPEEEVGRGSNILEPTDSSRQTSPVSNIDQTLSRHFRHTYRVN